MKGTFIFLFLLLSFFSFSQKTEKPTTYKLLRDNTDTKFLVANISLANLTVSGSRMSLAGGPGARFYANGFYAAADYEFHYLDGLADALKSDATTAYSVYKNQKSRNAEAAIGYFFRKKVEKKVSIFLYNDRQMSNTINYYANVDAHINKIFGFQLGYKSGFVNTHIPSGTDVRSYDDAGSASQSSSFNMSTVMLYNCISFGPSYGKIEDVVVDIEGYGIRKAQFFSRFYANILFAPTMKFEDVYYEVENQTGTGSSGTLLYRYTLDGSVKLSRLGFNVGYETFKFNKAGLSNKIELGLMPGVKTNLIGNFYLSYKIGFSLGRAFPK